MVSLLLFLILAVILIAIFSHMAIYVIGGVIGILIVLIAAIVRRRRSR